MASLALRRLSQAHRIAQARLGAQTVIQLHRVFRLLDPSDVTGSFDDWLTAVTPIVQRQHLTSQQIAANYLETAKRLELGHGAVTDVQTVALSEEALTTSMLVTGPISIRQAMSRGTDLDLAAEVADAASGAAGMRHALEGGRDLIVATLLADPQAKGWERVTSGKTCDFCSMLADRGAVYGADSADFQAHDGCSCSAEPVYA